MELIAGIVDFAEDKFSITRVTKSNLPARFKNVDELIKEYQKFIKDFDDAVITDNEYIKDHVINMDETSINFVPEIKNTLEKKGSTKIYLRNFKGEKKRVTVCLSINYCKWEKTETSYNFQR